MWRKKKKSNMLTYVVSFILVLIIWFVYYSGVFEKTIPLEKITNSTWTNLSWNNEKTPTYYANSLVSWTGELVLIPYDIKLSTKFKLKYNNQYFFAKSDKYVLDDFIGKKITFSGEVIWFATDNTPVLNIIDIASEDDNQQELTWTDLTWEVKTKIYSITGLELDLEWTDFDAQIDNNNIVIYKTWTNLSWDEIRTNLLKIEQFECQKGSSLYDCEALKNQSNVFNFKKITSNNWVTFYGLPETNQYVVLWKKYGYNVYLLTWDIYNFVNFIKVNEEEKNTEKKQLTNNDIKAAALNVCKKKDIKLAYIMELKKLSDSTYIVKWFDDYSNKLVCKISISENPFVAKLISLDFEKNNSENTTWTVIENNQPDANKYLVYTSKAYGFTVYMPKSSKFESHIIKNSLWISGLTCLQQINVADWKTGTLKDPELKVLYCKTNLDKESISKLLQTSRPNNKVIQKNNKTFIILFKNTDIAQKMLNNLLVY